MANESWQSRGNVHNLAEIGGKQNGEADVDRVAKSECQRVGDEASTPRTTSIGLCLVTARLKKDPSGAWDEDEHQRDAIWPSCSQPKAPMDSTTPMSPQ
jgi:hypothetical protein